MTEDRGARPVSIRRGRGWLGRRNDLMTMSRLMIALRSGLAFAVCAVAGTLASVALAAPAVTTANVNLRQGPSTDYQIIVTVPASAAVDVEGCASGWCKVDYAGSAGWISEDYLQGLSSPPVIVLPPPVVVLPGRHHHYYPPHHRPPVVVPPRPPGTRPPHHRPPGIHPPPQRPPHQRPPGTNPPPHRPPVARPPTHRPPNGGGGGRGRPHPGGGQPRTQS
jgi:uncharacterized protein YraI